jgi:long-chain fatty acid transport protein
VNAANPLRRFLHLVIFFLPLVAYGGSFSLSEQSVSSLGSAYAGGAAQAEDASTLFFNPAGIVLLDQGELQLGAQLVTPSADFHNEGSRYVLPGTPFNNLPLSGGNGGDAGGPNVLPNAYLTQPIFRNKPYGDLSVGVGLSVPFGLETDYDPGWVGRYSALRTKLTTFDIQPTVSYRLFDRISLGASVDFQRASARLSQAIDFGLAAQPLLGQFYAGLPAALTAQGVPPALIGPTVATTEQAYAGAGFVPGGRDGVTEVQGDDWSVGFTLGAIFEYRKPGDDNSFWQEGRVGVSYRSAIDHTLDGRADFRGVPAITAAGAPVQFPVPGALQGVFFNQNASAQLDLPDILHFSIYQRFARQYAIMSDIAWTHWSRLQEVPITFENPGTPTNVLEINYDDAVRYSVGFEWYATHALTLRTGFAYDETPIQSADFRTPRIPDNDRYFLSAGLKWSVTDFLDFDVAYAHLFVDQPDVNLLDDQGHLLRGNYDASVDIVSASLTFRWGGGRPAEVAPVSSKDVAGYRK